MSHINLETITKREIEVKRFDKFSLYYLGLFWVIGYSGSYRTADRQKVYKTHRKANEAWENILSGKTGYTNF